MSKPIKSRIESLEAGKPGELPDILACESMTKPGIYSVSEVGTDHEIERGLTWDQVLERYEGRRIIHFHYTDQVEAST